MSCEHPQCNLEIFENNKCIFHCEQDTWFIGNDKNKINALNERMNLANRIEQMRKQFISELKNIE